MTHQPLRPLAVVVLAAGRGKRFPGVPSKVLVQLTGRPLIKWVLDSVGAVAPSRTVVVVGHGRDAVLQALQGYAIETVVQHEPLGTGHATLAAEEVLAGLDLDVLVLNGDVPLVKTATLKALHARLADHRVGGALLTASIEQPAAYGRIVRDASGGVAEIVEFADASPAEAQIKEINVGSYAFRAPQLFDLLRTVSRNNAQGEIYLTDVIKQLVEAGRRVEAVGLQDPVEGTGVNSPEELVELERRLNSRSGPDDGGH